MAWLAWLTQVGELATERVLRIAKAAEEARKKGLEAARAAGDLELGAGDGVGTLSCQQLSQTGRLRSCPAKPFLASPEARRRQAAVEVAAAESAASATPGSAASGGSYGGDEGVIYSEGAAAAEGEGEEPSGSKACAIQ